ncbi:MAG TPA: protein kinase [Gemmatimonadaceae bacterium]
MTSATITVSDRYRVLRELGHGGMATVYLAFDTRYEREVAIKVLDPEIAQGVAAERFLREIDVAAKVSHPHIVPLLDSGTTDGRLWFVMPVLEGQSLRERLDKERQLPIGESLRIAREVASALAYAHARGVIHRDIKPENVLLSGGSAALADFGLAKGLAASDADTLTRTGYIVGTAFYMSPEQASGQTVDGRSDIYSLGCVLYEMLAGEPPYVGKTVQAVIAKRFSDPIPSARRLRSAISPALDEVIKHALATSPADRFQTADEFATALSSAVGSDPDGVAQPAVAPRRAARVRDALIGGAIIAVLAVTGIVVAKRGAIGGGSHTPRSIAVLPFDNLSDDKAQEYFSAGMTDELLSALSGIKQLRVAARASSYAIHNKTADLGEIGRRLNVEAVLDGTVRKDGDHVRVSAELVSVGDGFRIWSDTYDRKLTDVFSMQEEIARAIVSAVRIDLGGQAHMVRKPTEDMAAYELYLRGRHAVDLRTAASLQQGAEYFRQATDRDPLYAKAWAGLADDYILQALNFYDAPADAYPKGKAAALKAVALDSTLADAYTSLGTVRFLYDRDFVGAAAAYDHAITLDPKYPVAHYFNSIFLTGRDNARAEREAQLAAQLDPLSPPMAQAVGMLRVSTGRYADAIAPLKAAIAVEPRYYFPHAWLGMALAHAGTPAQALAEEKLAEQLNPGNALVLAYLGEVYATTGDRASALRVVAQIDSISKTRPVCGVYVARIFDRLGDADHAFEWLDRAVAAHEGQLPQIVWPDAFTKINSDPRFARLVKQLGLTS